MLSFDKRYAVLNFSGWVIVAMPLELWVRAAIDLSHQPAWYRASDKLAAVFMSEQSDMEAEITGWSESIEERLSLAISEQVQALNDETAAYYVYLNLLAKYLAFYQESIEKHMPQESPLRSNYDDNKPQIENLITLIDEEVQSIQQKFDEEAQQQHVATATAMFATYQHEMEAYLSLPTS